MRAVSQLPAELPDGLRTRESSMQVRFGDFVLDTDTRELLRESRPVHLSPKAFQLLELLVETRPRALPKDTCTTFSGRTFRRGGEPVKPRG